MNLRKCRHQPDHGCTWTFDRCIPNWGIGIWYQVCTDGSRLRKPHLCNLLFRHRPSSRGCTHWENIQTGSCGMFLWSERFDNLFHLPGKHSRGTDHTILPCRLTSQVNSSGLQEEPPCPPPPPPPMLISPGLGPGNDPPGLCISSEPSIDTIGFSVILSDASYALAIETFHSCRHGNHLIHRDDLLILLHQERFPQSHLSYYVLHWSSSDRSPSSLNPLHWMYSAMHCPFENWNSWAGQKNKAPHLNNSRNRWFHCIARIHKDRIRWHRGKYGLYRNSGTHQINPGIDGWSHKAIDKVYSLQNHIRIDALRKFRSSEGSSAARSAGSAAGSARLSVAVFSAAGASSSAGWAVSKPIYGHHQYLQGVFVPGSWHHVKL